VKKRKKRNRWGDVQENKAAGCRHTCRAWSDLVRWSPPSEQVRCSWRRGRGQPGVLASTSRQWHPHANPRVRFGVGAGRGLRVAVTSVKLYVCSPSGHCPRTTLHVKTDSHTPWVPIGEPPRVRGMTALISPQVRGAPAMWSSVLGIWAWSTPDIRLESVHGSRAGPSSCQTGISMRSHTTCSEWHPAHGTRYTSARCRPRREQGFVERQHWLLRHEPRPTFSWRYSTAAIVARVRMSEMSMGKVSAFLSRADGKERLETHADLPCGRGDPEPDTGKTRLGKCQTATRAAPRSGPTVPL